jgi:ribosomal-protein-alanine N-acetyltransferase
MSEKAAFTVKIRKATKADCKFIYQLAEQSRLEHWSQMAYEEECSNKNSVFLVACGKGERVIGFSVTRWNYFAEADLLNIAVSPDYRKMAAGYLLLKQTEAILRENNVRELFLHVRESNLNAINFYTRNGFKLLEKIQRFYSNPEENGLRMSKQLK